MAVEERRGQAAKGYQGGHAASASRNADCTTQGPADHALRVYLMRVSGQGSPRADNVIKCCLPTGRALVARTCGKAGMRTPNPGLYTNTRPHMCLARRLRSYTNTAARAYDNELGQCEQDPCEYPVGHSRVQQTRASCLLSRVLTLHRFPARQRNDNSAGADDQAQNRRTQNRWWHAGQVAWCTHQSRDHKVR